MTKNPVKYTTVRPLLSGHFNNVPVEILLYILRKVDPTDHLHVKLVCKDLQQLCRHRHNNHPHLRRSSQSNATPPSRTSFPRKQSLLSLLLLLRPAAASVKDTQPGSSPTLKPQRQKGQPHVQSPAVILRLKVLEPLAASLASAKRPGIHWLRLPKSDVRCMPDGGSSRRKAANLLRLGVRHILIASAVWSLDSGS